MLHRLKQAGILFATLVGAASAIFGLAFASTQQGSTPMLSLGIGALSLCVLISIGYFVLPWFMVAVQRISKYPSLLRTHGNALSDLEDCRREIASVPELLERARQEERQNIIGDVLARAFGTDLEIVAVGNVDDTLTFVASVDGNQLPLVGSRYLVRFSIFRQTKGAVTVVGTEPPNLVHLAVTQHFGGSAEFWEQLQQASYLNEKPPSGLKLVLDEMLETILEKAQE